MERGREIMVHKKRIRKVLLICILTLLLTACDDASTEENVVSEINDSSITVYIPTNVTVSDEEDSYHLFRFGEIWGGNRKETIYGEAIDEFARTRGLEVNVVYFDNQEMMEMQLQKDIEENTMPDVILCDATTTQTVYSYIMDGNVIDLMPYLEKREEGDYTQALMEACQQGDKQFMLPLLYDVAAFYTTNDQYQENYIGVEDGVWLLDSEMNRLWKDEEIKEVLYPAGSGSGNPVGSWYILWNALGSSAVQWDTATFSLSEEQLSVIASFVKRYYEFETDFDDSFIASSYAAYGFYDTPDRSALMRMLLEDAFEYSWNHSDDKEESLALYRDTAELISFRLDGVTACNWPYSSMAVQAQYYNTVLSWNNKKFSLVPLSLEESSPSYNASILLFGFISSTSENPGGAAELLLFLQDTLTQPYYGFSVNESVNEQNLKRLEGTAYVLKDMFQETAYIAPGFVIEPLPHATADQVREVLAHIDKATLPNRDFEACFYNALIKYIIEEGSWQDIYQQLQKDLETTIKEE